MLITYQSTVLDIAELVPAIVSLKCSRPDNAEWSYKAGQYLILHVPQSNGHPVRRLYSIASHPSHTEYIEFVIEIVPSGIGGSYISTLKKGDTITLQGPAGLFTYKSVKRPPVFIATGTGIAPMRSMMHELAHEKNLPQKSMLLWGLKQYKDLYLADELLRFRAIHPQITLNICLSREENWNQVNKLPVASILSPGRVTTKLDTISAAKELNLYDFYLCGSKHVVEGLREYLALHQVPEKQVFFEKFT